jgi:hypothetical protein
MTALEVFKQNDGGVTKSYYEKMNGISLLGQLAVALFRAQKRSTAAKRYRGGQYRHAAYDVKNWSLSEICRVMTLIKNPFEWGWGEDPNTPGFPWVLYVELPVGQVSFHSAERLQGPQFLGHWDGAKGATVERVLAFCDLVESGRVQILETK